LFNDENDPVVLLPCRRGFQDGLLGQLAGSEATSTFIRRLSTLSSAVAGRASSIAVELNGYASVKELLLANQHVWPELEAPLLLLVLQQGDEVDKSVQHISGTWLSVIINGRHPSEMQQLLQHLPSLLLEACHDRTMHRLENQADLAAVVAAHAAEQGNLQPEQLHPVLQALVQSSDERTASAASRVIGKLMLNAQVRVKLCEQAATQLSGLLLAACRNIRGGLEGASDLAAAVAAHETEQGNLQPEQLQPVLQALVQSTDEGTASAASRVVRKLMRNAQVRVKLCEQAANQLPALLAVTNLSRAASTAVLEIAAAAVDSAALRQALHLHAGEALAALQQLLRDVLKEAPRNNLLDPWQVVVHDIKGTLLWLLWESNGGQAAAAAAGIE
jgi:hypothetical protein